MNKERAREIINLECDSDCPSFNNIPWNEKFCIYHALKGPCDFFVLWTMHLDWNSGSIKIMIRVTPNCNRLSTIFPIFSLATLISVCWQKRRAIVQNIKDWNMNSQELQDYLALTSYRSVGVFPTDQIPKVWTKPTAYIFNTQGHKYQELIGSLCMSINLATVGISIAMDFHLLFLIILIDYERIAKDSDGTSGNCKAKPPIKHYSKISKYKNISEIFYVISKKNVKQCES